METYQVGTGNQQVKLAVDIDTFGLAASRAIIFDPNSTEPSINVGTSANASGDISQTQIGLAASLQKKRLSVLTKIEIIGDVEFKRKECQRLSGKYILDDGSEGHKVFNNPEKTVADDFSGVVLTILIDLIS